VTRNWPGGPIDAPDSYQSHAMSVFGDQGSYLRNNVLHIPDGTG
jgi:hypothetical protein